MPIARFEMPDGRIARFEVPEGLTPEQATSMIEQEIAGQPKGVRTLAESDAMIAAQNEAAPWYERLGTGAKIGMGRAVLGAAELGQNIMEAAGASRDQRYHDLLAEAQKEADAQDKGTGVAGFAGNVLGDPLTYLPVGAVAQKGKVILGVGRKAGLKTAIKESAKLGAKTGAIAGAMQGTGDANSDIISNITRAGMGAGIGAGAGAILAPVTHLGAKAIRSTTKAGRQGLASDAVEMADEAAKPLYDDYSSVLKGIGEVEDAAGAKFNNFEAAVDNLPNVGGSKLSDVVNNLKSWSDDLSQDMFAKPEQKTTLKRIINQIENGDDVSVRDLVQIKKFSNSRFGKYDLGSPEARNDAITNSKIESILDDVIPEGSKARTLREDANTFFRNEVVPLREKTLKKFGLDVDKVKEDQYALKAVESGDLEKLPLGYRERARLLPEKLGGNVEAYKEVAPLVSPDRMESFNKNVAQHSGATAYRGIAPIKAIALGGWGALTGNKAMLGRAAIELGGAIKGRDPIHDLIKQGVAPNTPRMQMQKQIANVIGREIKKEAEGIKNQKIAEAMAAQAREQARELNPAQKAAMIQKELLSPAGQAAYNQQMINPNAVQPFEYKARAAPAMRVLEQESQAAQAKKLAEEMMMQEQLKQSGQVTAGQAAERAAALRELEAVTGRGRANNIMEEQMLNALKNQKRKPLKITIRPSDKGK